MHLVRWHFLTPSRKWVRGPFIPCQITEEKQLLQVTSAHDSGSGAALFLPCGFRKDFWAANPGHAGTTQPVCKQLRHALLATQSIFPSCVSLNKVELASISPVWDLLASCTVNVYALAVPTPSSLPFSSTSYRSPGLHHLLTSLLPSCHSSSCPPFLPFSLLSFNQKENSYRM